ncbi:hypothetical protein IVG45_12370 [Methylomonas sp. LL1]|uniref:hypothetical protein n=1 Tax=Methylomonas sp. LL1 TaxID=2785785 RepID=UPI0018C41BE0|nr:hypothetical protein [Methylomonas sp. LL1]QPK61675.1 hypothetical protein IVG45_12370 [Methylomonas sp. LL1]
MTIPDLLGIIEDLAVDSAVVTEESRRLTIEGQSLNGAIRNKLARLLDILSQEDCSGAGVIRVSDTQNLGSDDLSDASYDDEPWRFVLAKSALAKKVPARDVEDTLLFFSLNGFHRWLETVDPFVHPVSPEPDFVNPTTIRVNGLQHAYGSESLWVLPVAAPVPEAKSVSMPPMSEIHGLIHVNAADRSIRVCPSGFALTWGVINENTAGPLLKMSALVLSACLVQELKRVDGRYEATLRGTKRVSMPLEKPGQIIQSQTLAKLVETVAWVYQERPETRLKLVMDRLSIDSQAEDTLLFCMQEYLDVALQQARDSYAFVILERKDAYHKEMRELMKDMKAQADLFAAKVRDLVASLTRDILGILVFIGFSFIGKFDQKNLASLLISDELSLVVKFLAGYLILSCALQLIMHWRDVSLTYRESQKWLDTLQNYTSRKDKEDNFLSLLNKRKKTLYIAMVISGVFYAVLSVVTWNLPCLIQRLLAL